MKARCLLPTVIAIWLVAAFGSPAGTSEGAAQEPTYRDKPLRHWLAAIKDPRKEVRQEAAGALGYLEPATRAAVPALRAALKDSAAGVRGRAAASLVAVDPSCAREALPFMIKALEDADSKVGRGAAEALGSIGPAARAAVPPLRALLGDEEKREVRLEAALALAKIDPKRCKEAIPVLVNSLKSFYPAIGLRPDMIALKRLAHFHKDTVAALVDVLRQQAPEDKTGNLLGCNDPREKAAFALGLIGPDAKSAAAALQTACKGPDGELRVSAAYALIQIDPAYVTDAVRVLTAALRDRREEVRSDAIWVLGEIGPAARDAVPALLRAYKPDLQGEEGLYIVQALALADPTAKGTMTALTRMLKDRDYTAVIGLKLIGPPAREAVPLLIDLLKDKGESLQFLAAQALARIDPRRAVVGVPALAAGLEHDQQFMDIFEALEAIGPAARAAVPALKTALKAWEPGMRPFAFRALFRIAPAEAKKRLPALRAGLKNPKPEERRCAARMLGLAGEAAVEAVPELVAALQDPEMGDEAADALGRIGPRAAKAVPALVKVFQNADRARARLYDLPDGGATKRFTLLETLKDQDRVECLDTARVGEQATPISADFMLEMLAARSIEIRMCPAVARALGRIGPVAREAVPLLRAARQDRDADVRLAAACALVRVQPAEAEDVIGALRAALRDPAWEVRSGAATALGDMGPAAKVAAPGLKALLQDPVKFVRREAGKALKQVDVRGGGE